MKISEIQIIPIKPSRGLVAFASVVLNNQFYISNIAIYVSLGTSSGYRLVYPDKFLPNGKRVHCFHPITKEAGDFVCQAIIERYKELIKELVNNE